MGYGSKVTLLKGNNDNISFLAFRAKDQYSNNAQVLIDSLNILPSENLILGTVLNKQLGKKITISGEYNSSAFTRDNRQNSLDINHHNYLNNLGSIYKTNATTEIHNAFKASIVYHLSKYQVSLDYRRIDPGYRSLGNIFLNNDLEDLSVNSSWRLMKNKINVTLGGGFQRNNLDNKQVNEMSRLAGRVSINYLVSKKVNIMINHNNFTSTTRFNNENITVNSLNLIQNADSLRFNQVTSNSSIGFNYNTGTETIKHVVNGLFSLQQGNDSKNNSSSFQNANLGYSLNLVPQLISIRLSGVYSLSNFPGNSSRNIGPAISINKQMLKKKIRAGLSIAHQASTINERSAGSNLISNFSIRYNHKKHSVNLNSSRMERIAGETLGDSFVEWRATISYGFHF